MVLTIEGVPTFVNTRSADLILSDVRPTAITSDALRAVNIFLDELLWLTLANARSFETYRLKVGVLKSASTRLGRDAVLEAEIEIRAYRDKTHARRPITAKPPDEVLAAFPVQEAFEFLRLKCQLMSSFAEFDEAPGLEAKVLERLHSKSTLPLSPEQLSSAPLYLTAVIEHICQHALSNIAKVVARDSSRTTADLPIVYTSLCEDPLIYPFLKKMKVQGHIQSRIQRMNGTNPHGSSPSVTITSMSPSAFKPPHSGTFTPNSSAGMRPSAESGSRKTSPSVRRGYEESSDGRSSVGNEKKSAERGHGKKFFSNGVETDGSHRAQSIASAGSKKGARSSDSIASGGGTTLILDEGQARFEELLDSGGTMKVSLTPDRMRTFDLLRPKSRGRTPTTRNERPIREKVVSANNAPEEESKSAPMTPRSGYFDNVPSRARSRSVAQFLKETGPPDSSNNHIPPVPAIPSLRSSQVLALGSPVHNGASTSAMSPSLSPTSSSQMFPTSSPSKEQASSRWGLWPVKRGNTNKSLSRDPLSVSSVTNGSTKASVGYPHKLKRKEPGRERGSVDLDELLKQDDNEPEQTAVVSPVSSPPRRKSNLQAKSAIASSSDTKDLLMFLQSQPPGGDRSRNSSISQSTSPVSLAVPRPKGGRLGGVMSKFRRSSNESFLSMDPSELRTQQRADATQSIPRHRSQNNLQAAKSSVISPTWTFPLPPTPPKPPQPDEIKTLAPPISVSNPEVPELPELREPPEPPETEEPKPTVREVKAASNTFSTVSTSTQVPPSPISMKFKPESHENSQTSSPRSELEEQNPSSPIPPPEVDDAQAIPVVEEPRALSPLPRSPLRPSPVETKPQSPLDAQMPPSPTSPNTLPPAKAIEALAEAYQSGQPPPGLVEYAASSKSQGSETTKSEISSPSQPELSKEPQAIWHTHAVELRDLLRRAQDADECRLLLDLFLIRMGVPIPSNEQLETPSSSNNKEESIVEMFLSDGRSPRFRHSVGH